ncbi:hypothetical protein [Plantactinospora endophytica]|uniref:DUF222 domain-containing protein n=1 Tax=Plantactinospora endophytica TaxID=673535 RepID=A0ABQ4EDB0_9ACTN|nr:hypothetical protein [Plantactinospora endophytica]GIG92712.1 hypothetical protein Pen02_76480 [Plantactinospora endophytica]
MIHRSFDQPERPPTTPAPQHQRLAAELAACQQALCDIQGRLADARHRLALISKIARDDARCRRAPTVSWAAVRAALYAQPDTLDRIGADLPLR